MSWTEKKVWGEVEHYEYLDQVGTSRLKVEKGSYCSVHRHTDRVNHFIIIEGIVLIKEFGKGEKPTEHPTQIVPLAIRTGFRTFTVPAGIWHQFVVQKSGLLVEVYWTDNGAPVRFDDIERHSLGGTL